MFVTSSNFITPPYNIPNLDKVVNTFSNYVNALEEEALVKLLGRQLYKSFIDGLAALPGEYNSATQYALNAEVISGNNIYKSLQNNNSNHALTDGAWWELVEENNKWLKLKKGSEYTYPDKVWTWKGLANLLTPFIYSRYVYDNVDSFTGNGVVVPQNENSAIISPSLRITRANNEYCARVGIVRGYREMVLSGRSFHYADCMSYQDTFYGFMLANYQADYAEWSFEQPELMNIAGI